MGGHVLRETTSRGLCGLVCPSRTSERGGEGDCVKEGGEEVGKCERERALERLRYYIPGHSLCPGVCLSQQEQEQQDLSFGNRTQNCGWCKPLTGRDVSNRILLDCTGFQENPIRNVAPCECFRFPQVGTLSEILASRRWFTPSCRVHLNGNLCNSAINAQNSLNNGTGQQQTLSFSNF
jgi:hypothetical protein